MNADRQPPDRIVTVGGASILVRCRPRGSELRDLTDHRALRWIQWTTAWPGVISLVGLLLHRTVYRRAWRVTAAATPGQTLLYTSPDLPLEHAVAAHAALVAWLAQGRPPGDFQPIPEFRARHV